MAADRTVNVFFSLDVPSGLLDALADLQTSHQERVEPQQREHIHITLGFVHDADAARLADAAALVSGRTWPAPVVRLTGEVRHGSWQLRKNPSYRYDDELVQKQEQIRLGVEHTPELGEIYAGITEPLGIAEDGFWPHVTLGLAREDLPVGEVKAMDLPSAGEVAPGLNLQQELSVTDFRILVRRELA
ncbi:2'-5' RNA ligase family protein [Streptomyces sp. I05A-00742]|uniref:2'-5' RNA ligase family protein n=1 Tax=Streptomyces sp. I05A-00742 TaxID=2732853 RepID=UPI001487F4A8|nr:2'-5' RNA ligase family protein [Streptomyces sp. I05A-00742]